MMLTDGGVARALTWRYVVALSLVAMLVTAAWFSLHLVISEQQSTAAVVNVSGRQRMLSQRTALFAVQLANVVPERRAAARAQLREAAALMRQSHHDLIHGNAALALPATMSEAVRTLYFQPPLDLNSQVESYLDAVQVLLDLPDARLRPDCPELAPIVTAAPARLVASLDQVVAQYQREGEAAVARLHQIETGVWLLTLFLLLLEATLIFHPFTRHLRHVLARFKSMEERLRRSQEDLEERVRLRTADLAHKGAALEESEERFRKIGTAAHDAILIIDSDETITYWNPAATAIFGYTAEQATGQNMHDLLAPPRFRADIVRGFAKFCVSGDGPVMDKTIEAVALHRDGRELPIELSISAMYLAGRLHALGIIRDISERKRREELLTQQHAELERSNAELEQFAYVTSHDLREPLRMVSSYMALLERKYGPQLDADAHDFIGFARDGAQRMDRLVQDLLDYSRVGRIAEPARAVPAGELVEGALAVLGATLAEADGQVLVADTLPEVMCSPSEGVRLFQNLIGNAVKFRAADRPPVVEVSCHRDGAFWQFAVADNGIGIEPEHFQRIFMIFQRLHGRDQYPGTGIGLAICKKIVEGHGGRLWVESTPDHGSVFRFTLPAVAAAASSA